MTTIDLEDAGARALVAKRILNEIDAYSIKTFSDGFRWHLGASIIGESCTRALWYKYRWVKHEQLDGRRYRLFQRGHLEELRYIEYLEGIGCKVHSKDNEGKQYKVSWLHGHFGGSVDAVIEFPQNWGISIPVLGEFKTKGTGKGFNQLLSKGVAKTDFQHFAQACTYGFGYNLQYGAYFSTNKNDDDMHIEFLKLDHNVGQQMIVKAERIITSNHPPERISDNPLYEDCKFCDFTDICHSGAPVTKNCRSCIKCLPTEKAEFFCQQENAVIPREIVAKGCGGHESINVIKKKIIEIKPIEQEPKYQIEDVPLPT